MTARERQAETILTERKRQVERIERIERLRDPDRGFLTHHGYAVCVKDHRMSFGYDEDEYRIVCETFWSDAEWIALQHGFEGVTSEGRMGGWCKPFPQPRTDDMYEHEIEAWELDTFGPFALEIVDLLRRLQDEFYVPENRTKGGA